ncbi:site-specific integrase [Halalkalibacter okhensis]|uniref:site-specific integrase n=1 Tax=Halalkalibacter okhensis TaxID=333138 RepID=UPI001EEF2828|nr:site-specific integrase [Halalkalibacter okhensis]
MEEQSWLDLFITYLQLEKNRSVHTMKNYKNDITDFMRFMEDLHIPSFTVVTVTDIHKYIAKLYENEYSGKTVARKVSALRSFYSFI